MYSTDRKKALDLVISCLEDMPLYEECQKTLVVDGLIDVVPSGWRVVEVPRIRGKFCWADMWDAGVSSARHENVVYLDSDRLLPQDYLQLVEKNIADDTFLFTSNHFMMSRELEVDECKEILLRFSQDGVLTDEKYLGCVRFEPRFERPVHGPGKNVMSGSTAFTKKTYRRIGGVDPWYRGHGAFADTDFHFSSQIAGCNFVDLGIPELHYPHPKRGKESKELGEMTLRRLGLYNFIYYCDKWNLPMVLAESVAHECDLKRPAVYVQKKLKEIRANAKESA